MMLILVGLLSTVWQNFFFFLSKNFPENSIVPSLTFYMECWSRKSKTGISIFGVSHLL